VRRELAPGTGRCTVVMYASATHVGVAGGGMRPALGRFRHFLVGNHRMTLSEPPDMERPAIITLLTDFGQQDTYVGVMKGVIAGVCPAARVIDLTHGIEPQNVRQAALLLAEASRYFPSGAIHMAVVDPGVGSDRRAVAVCAGEHLYVAPGNGVLTHVAAVASLQAVELSNRDYWLPTVSRTERS